MMDEDIKNNIFYRPDLSVEKNYYSEGEFTTPQREESRYSPPDTEKNRLHEEMKAVRDQLLSVRKVLGLLPLSLPEIIEEIVDTLILMTQLNILELERIMINEIEENNIDYYPGDDGGLPENQEIVYTVDNSENPDQEPSTLTVYEYNGTALDVEIEKAESIEQQCRNQYLKDLTDMTNDYSLKLNSVIQAYLYPLFDVLNTTGLDAVDYLNYEYDGTSVTGITTELQHVNDRIVTQDAICEELDSMFVKTHSSLKLKNTLEAFDIAECFRERYYKEDYKLDISNYLELYQKTSLEESRRKSEEAYSQCKMNVYNFLDTSVKNTEDICKRKLDSEQAKALLLTKDINIYAHKEYETTGVENSATKNTAKIVTGTGAPVLTDSEYPGNQVQSAANTVTNDNSMSSLGSSTVGGSTNNSSGTNNSGSNSSGTSASGSVSSNSTTTGSNGVISINILDLKGSINSVKNLGNNIVSQTTKGVQIISNQVNTNINNELTKAVNNVNKETNKVVQNVNKEVTKGAEAVTKEITKVTNNAITKGNEIANKAVSEGSNAATKISKNSVKTAKKITSENKK